MEESLTDFLENYFEKDEDYSLLTEEEQLRVYKTFNTILAAIYQVMTFENVTPLIFAADAKSGKAINRTLRHYAKSFPPIENIEVIIVN